MIYIIDSNMLVAQCVARAVGGEAKVFTNAIEAMNKIACGDLPEMIFMEIMLDGPDGFSFLNELISYNDTAKIPVVIASSLPFSKKDLNIYGVVGVLNKETMTPEDIKKYVEKYAKRN